MRAVVIAVASLSTWPGTTAHAAEQHLTVQFIADPGQLPDDVCVVSAESPRCYNSTCRRTEDAKLIRDGEMMTLVDRANTARFRTRDVGRSITVAGKHLVIASVSSASTITYRDPTGAHRDKVTAVLDCTCGRTTSHGTKPQLELSEFDAAHDQSQATSGDQAFEEAIDALQLDGIEATGRSCQVPAACPTWLAPVDRQHEHPYVTCVRNGIAPRADANLRLVAIIGVMGSVQAIQELNLTGSRLELSFSEPVATLWVSVLGGSYATGLSIPVVDFKSAGSHDLSANVPIERRCQARSIEIPRSGLSFQSAKSIMVKENGSELLHCTPGPITNNRTTVQIPLGDEGVLRSVHVELGTYEAAASWATRAAPLDTRLSWQHFSFSIGLDPRCTLLRACPSADIAGADCGTPISEEDKCRYECKTLPGATVTTPVDVTVSIDGMSWSERLEVALSTITTAPPAEIRRLFLDGFDPSADEIDLEGPRDFRRKIKREFLQTSQQWVSFPGLQCSDPISYRYLGRFDSDTVHETVSRGTLKLKLVQDTLRYTVSMSGGIGVVLWELSESASAFRSELRKHEAYAILGGEFGKPFQLGNQIWDGRFAYRLGTALHLTPRPYRTVQDQHANTYRTAGSYRSIVYALLGFNGIKFPSCNWCRPANLWLQLGAGFAGSLDRADERATNWDFIMTAGMIYEIQLSGRIWLATGLGTLLFEDVLHYRTDYRGNSRVESKSGWRHMRFMPSLTIKVTL